MDSMFDKAVFIKDAVQKMDDSSETIEKIKSCLSIQEKFGFTGIPIYKIAIAGLHMLGVEEYTESDEGVLYFIEVFKNMKN